MPNSFESPNLAGMGKRQRAAAELRARDEVAKRPPQDDPQEQGEPLDTGPVGQGEYIVSQGECMSSIAVDTGHYWKKIWNYGPNAELQSVRKNPNVLLPGDQVTIPEKISKEEAGAAEMRHRFVRRGEPTILRIQVREVADESDPAQQSQDALPEDDDDGYPIDKEAPCANAPFVMDIDGQTSTGMTDAGGYIDVPISGNAKRAILLVGDETNLEKYEFVLGGVDPISELSGVQHRLNNLDFRCGPPDGQLGENTQRAVRHFQKQHSLPLTGEADAATRAKLVEEHAS